jgi:hypothetical protein
MYKKLLLVMKMSKLSRLVACKIFVERYDLRLNLKLNSNNLVITNFKRKNQIVFIPNEKMFARAVAAKEYLILGLLLELLRTADTWSGVHCDLSLLGLGLSERTWVDFMLTRKFHLGEVPAGKNVGCDFPNYHYSELPEDGFFCGLKKVVAC